MALHDLAIDAPDPATVLAFRTFREGRDRTVGPLAVLASGDAIGDWTGSRAKALIEALPDVPAATPVARGKLAVVDMQSAMPTAAVFQLAPGGCGRVFCGNGAASLAAYIAAVGNMSDVTFVLSGSSATPVTVKATVRGAQVSQVWVAPERPEIKTASPAKLNAVEIDLFNNYIVVDVSSGDVTHLLQDTDPRRRIAAVDMRGDEPRVAFFTSGRAHPSAPLTGLAALALLAKHVDWLLPLRNSKTVLINGVAEPLPKVSISGEGIEFELPDTGVALEVIRVPMLASERAA